MCGIFGMIGSDNVLPSTLSAMKLLEYRGYDSVGVATVGDGEISVYKQTGRVDALSTRLQGVDTHIAIGHTRWATHGGVTDNNAHPFLSQDNRIALVHNGIIENFDSIKQDLLLQGVQFGSDTDSEVIVQLLARIYDRCGNMLSAMQQCVNILQGSFAIAVVVADSNSMYLARQDSPLSVCIEGDNRYVCSDANTISCFGSNVTKLPDRCIAVLGDELSVYDYQLTALTVDTDVVQCIGEVPHSDDYMYSEIMSIPRVAELCLKGYRGIPMPAPKIHSFRRIYIIGCGTAYHSGVVVAGLLRRWIDIDIHCVIASEFAYGRYPIDARTLAIFISQSGETADTIKACRKAKEGGACCYSLVNVPHSSLACISHYTTDILAGREIAVASTKAYTNSVLTLTMVAMDIAVALGGMSWEVYQKYMSQLHLLPYALDLALSQQQTVIDIVEQYNPTAVFFVGRDIDYATAMESSLKLKEISYIHSEAYPAGELKHGTLALIDSSVLLIAICTNHNLVNKCNNTIMEVASRGGNVVTLSQYALQCQEVISLPIVADICYPCLSIVPMQLLAYYYAKKLGNDVDKPKNLAKSVTVE